MFPEHSELNQAFVTNENLTFSNAMSIRFQVWSRAGVTPYFKTQDHKGPNGRARGGFCPPLSGKIVSF